MNKKIRAIVAILLLTVMIPMALIPSSATAPTIDTYYGTKAQPAMSADESKILLAEEKLHFYILDFPNFRSGNEEYKSYLTADYTLLNPTDQKQSVKIAYPVTKSRGYNLYNTAGYDFTLNGETVEPTLRYTYNYWSDFSISEDLPLLSDEYLTDEFFNLDMPVTEYTVTLSGVDYAKYEEACVGLTLPYASDPERVLYIPGHHSGYTANNGETRIYVTPENKVSFTVYLFGTPYTALPSWRVYEDDFKSNEIGGSVSMVKKETVTLRDFIFADYHSELGISELDWHNIAMYELKQNNSGKRGYVSLSAYEMHYQYHCLLTWYQYEVEIEASDSATYSITQPLYPDVTVTHNPYIYTYRYTPSNLSRSEGAGIDVEIISDYFILSSYYGEEQIEAQKSYTLNGYPKASNDNTISFEICESENPEESTTDAGWFFVILFIILLPVVIIVLLVKLAINSIKLLIG